MTSAEDHSSRDAAAKKAIEANIEKYGCHLALLSPTNYLPGFAYSIGLYQKFGHPELICFGLDQNVLGAVLNDARNLVKAGGQSVLGIAKMGVFTNVVYFNVESFMQHPAIHPGNTAS